MSLFGTPQNSAGRDAGKPDGVVIRENKLPASKKASELKGPPDNPLTAELYSPLGTQFEAAYSYYLSRVKESPSMLITETRQETYSHYTKYYSGLSSGLKPMMGQFLTASTPLPVPEKIVEKEFGQVQNRPFIDIHITTKIDKKRKVIQRWHIPPSKMEKGTCPSWVIERTSSRGKNLREKRDVLMLIDSEFIKALERHVYNNKSLKFFIDKLRRITEPTLVWVPGSFRELCETIWLEPKRETPRDQELSIKVLSRMHFPFTMEIPCLQDFFKKVQSAKDSFNEIKPSYRILNGIRRLTPGFQWGILGLYDRISNIVDTLNNENIAKLYLFTLPELLSEEPAIKEQLRSGSAFLEEIKNILRFKPPQKKGGGKNISKQVQKEQREIIKTLCYVKPGLQDELTDAWAESGVEEKKISNFRNYLKKEHHPSTPPDNLDIVYHILDREISEGGTGKSDQRREPEETTVDEPPPQQVEASSTNRWSWRRIAAVGLITLVAGSSYFFRRNSASPKVEPPHKTSTLKPFARDTFRKTVQLLKKNSEAATGLIFTLPMYRKIDDYLSDFSRESGSTQTLSQKVTDLATNAPLIPTSKQTFPPLHTLNKKQFVAKCLYEYGAHRHYAKAVLSKNLDFDALLWNYSAHAFAAIVQHADSCGFSMDKKSLQINFNKLKTIEKNVAANLDEIFDTVHKNEKKQLEKAVQAYYECVDDFAQLVDSYPSQPVESVPVTVELASDPSRSYQKPISLQWLARHAGRNTALAAGAQLCSVTLTCEYDPFQDLSRLAFKADKPEEHRGLYKINITPHPKAFAASQKPTQYYWDTSEDPSFNPSFTLKELTPAPDWMSIIRSTPSFHRDRRQRANIAIIDHDYYCYQLFKACHSAGYLSSMELIQFAFLEEKIRKGIHNRETDKLWKILQEVYKQNPALFIEIQKTRPPENGFGLLATLLAFDNIASKVLSDNNQTESRKKYLLKSLRVAVRDFYQNRSISRYYYLQGASLEGAICYLKELWLEDLSKYFSGLLAESPECKSAVEKVIQHLQQELSSFVESENVLHDSLGTLSDWKWGEQDSSSTYDPGFALQLTLGAAAKNLNLNSDNTIYENLRSCIQKLRKTHEDFAKLINQTGDANNDSPIEDIYKISPDSILEELGVFDGFFFKAMGIGEEDQEQPTTAKDIHELKRLAKSKLDGIKRIVNLIPRSEDEKYNQLDSTSLELRGAGAILDQLKNTPRQ